MLRHKTALVILIQNTVQLRKDDVIMTSHNLTVDSHHGSVAPAAGCPWSWVFTQPWCIAIESWLSPLPMAFAVLQIKKTITKSTQNRNWCWTYQNPCWCRHFDHHFYLLTGTKDRVILVIENRLMLTVAYHRFNNIQLNTSRYFPLNWMSFPEVLVLCCARKCNWKIIQIVLCH